MAQALPLTRSSGSYLPLMLCLETVRPSRSCHGENTLTSQETTSLFLFASLMPSPTSGGMSPSAQSAAGSGQSHTRHSRTQSPCPFRGATHTAIVRCGTRCTTLASQAQAVNQPHNATARAGDSCGVHICVRAGGTALRPPARIGHWRGRDGRLGARAYPMRHRTRIIVIRQIRIGACTTTSAGESAPLRALSADDEICASPIGSHNSNSGSHATERATPKRKSNWHPRRTRPRSMPLPSPTPAFARPLFLTSSPRPLEPGSPPGLPAFAPLLASPPRRPHALLHHARSPASSLPRF
ncbi:hypothetical protein WOLCODRAFT_150291 [Wolfiporia cocos MD-104 SS10]|uniref:Uncharacterized protein n=1 Tax=Wolfiporia cocos (strain MD-104) TaxID=742152 RepID=A0A2H3JEE6_WOLCO|nr:hypothetical protein WOLCODRAFT_150291 [Wolfiporia cocos MD-104 SS10]